MRDALRTEVAAELGDPTGILVIDETGFATQGPHAVGVARQSCGTLGQSGTCQIGVFLSYASPQGHAVIDRALSVPRAWRDAPARCRQAGMPPDLPVQPKPQVAWAMLEQARDAGVPAAWVVADAVYGSDGALRRALEARGHASGLAARANQPVSPWPPDGPPAHAPVSDSVSAVSPPPWHRRSGGAGAQGPRLSAWAYGPLRPALHAGWGQGLRIRRPPLRPAETAWALGYAPVETPLDDLARAAGTRWTSEEGFTLAQGQGGLDQSAVRRGQGGHRPITRARFALAALATAAQKGEPPVAAISPSRSPTAAASWSVASGAPSRPRTGSGPGRAGAAATSGSPRTPTTVVA